MARRLLLPSIENTPLITSLFWPSIDAVTPAMPALLIAFTTSLAVIVRTSIAAVARPLMISGAGEGTGTDGCAVEPEEVGACCAPTALPIGNWTLVWPTDVLGIRS